MPGKKGRDTEAKTNENVQVERRGPVTVIVLDRPEARNALDGPTAEALASALRGFEADESASVGVLYGSGGNFCAGLDLKALAIDTEHSVRYEAEGDAPTGVARMTELSKPLIAAVEGYAVAAGLELAAVCDLRVASRESTFGMFNRRWGVALTDGGTYRLPRLVGQSRALDMILTGRPVRGPEAFEIGLVNRLVKPGETLDAAVRLAGEIARFPQAAVRADRRSVLEQWSLSAEEALKNEWRHGVVTWESGEIRSGAARFASGKGRHGSFENIQVAVRNDALYRVVIPRQNLVVRLNGLWPDIPEDEFMPAVRPYGILRMAQAIWREIPGVAPAEAFSFALRVRRKGEVEVLVATRFLADHVRLGLIARHHLVSRLERTG